MIFFHFLISAMKNPIICWSFISPFFLHMAFPIYWWYLQLYPIIYLISDNVSLSIYIYIYIIYTVYMYIQYTHIYIYISINIYIYIYTYDIIWYPSRYRHESYHGLFIPLFHLRSTPPPSARLATPPVSQPTPQERTCGTRQRQTTGKAG